MYIIFIILSKTPNITNSTILVQPDTTLNQTINNILITNNKLHNTPHKQYLNIFEIFYTKRHIIIFSISHLNWNVEKKISYRIKNQINFKNLPLLLLLLSNWPKFLQNSFQTVATVKKIRYDIIITFRFGTEWFDWEIFRVADSFACGSCGKSWSCTSSSKRSKRNSNSTFRSGYVVASAFQYLFTALLGHVYLCHFRHVILHAR